MMYREMPDLSRCFSRCEAAKEKAYQEALAARKAAEEAKVAEHQALSEMRRSGDSTGPPDRKRLGSFGHGI